MTWKCAVLVFMAGWAFCIAFPTRRGFHKDEPWLPVWSRSFFGPPQWKWTA